MNSRQLYCYQRQPKDNYRPKDLLLGAEKTLPGVFFSPPARSRDPISARSFFPKFVAPNIFFKFASLP